MLILGWVNVRRDTQGYDSVRIRKPINIERHLKG